MKTTTFLLAALLALGAYLACATTGLTVPPLPPLPGPNINDWGAHVPDGGGQ